MKQINNFYHQDGVEKLDKYMLDKRNLKGLSAIPVRLTIEEAEALEYKVDTTVYPPFAYKGRRFAPDESTDCYTDLEAELVKEVNRLRGLIKNG